MSCRGEEGGEETAILMRGGEWGSGGVGEWEQGEQGGRGAGGVPMPNAQCPMPNALCPILNAQCPMPNAQCPMPNALCPMPNAQCPMTISFVLESCQKDHRRQRTCSARYPNHRSHQLYREF